MEDILEKLQVHFDEIALKQKLDFIKRLENIKGTENIIKKVNEFGVPTHLLLNTELEKLIPENSKLRTLMAITPFEYIEKYKMVFFWREELFYMPTLLIGKNGI
jgi:hypothetical protein